MKKLILLTGLTALLVGSVADLEARPPRPKKQVEHFTFSPEHLEAKVEPYVGTYDRVILLNEFATQVAEGEPICRLVWTGRRIDTFLAEDVSEVTFEIELPRGAFLDGVEIYLVQPNGQDGKKVKNPDVEVLSDSLLVVTVGDLGKARVVDLLYRFDGTGITVDEGFVFQPQWPVLRTEYSFSVSRDLWQDAADLGLHWEFSAVTQPRTWLPEQADTPDYFSWYWRLTNVEPVDTSTLFTVPRSVWVSGFLPAPVLAGFDSDELPDFESLQDVMAFENSIQITHEEQTAARPSNGAGGLSSGGSVNPSQIPTGGGGVKGRR